jgi:hypothetical protein
LGKGGIKMETMKGTVENAIKDIMFSVGGPEFSARCKFAEGMDSICSWDGKMFTFDPIKALNMRVFEFVMVVRHEFEHFKIWNENRKSRTWNLATDTCLNTVLFPKKEEVKKPTRKYEKKSFFTKKVGGIISYATVLLKEGKPEKCFRYLQVKLAQYPELQKSPKWIEFAAKNHKELLGVNIYKEVANAEK